MIVFQAFFEILVFCNHIRVYINKSHCLYEGNLRAERIGNSGGQVSGMPC